MTLNAGFGKVRGNELSEESRDLVAQWLQNNKVTVVQPAAGSGNEQSRATAEHIAKARREFRKNARAKAKAAGN